MTNPSSAKIKCRDIAYGSPAYETNMDKLAAEADLPDAAWSKMHEEAVSSLCRGNSKSVNDLVANGYLPAEEAERIAAVLGKSFKSKSNPSAALNLKNARSALLELGVCNACADNAAQFLVKEPGSECAILTKRALDGDSRAIDELKDFPDFCNWQY